LFLSSLWCRLCQWFLSSRLFLLSQFHQLNPWRLFHQFHLSHPLDPWRLLLQFYPLFRWGQWCLYYL
jgi:hypothetical protein